jgi:hypothetical protein
MIWRRSPNEICLQASTTTSPVGQGTKSPIGDKVSAEADYRHAMAIVPVASGVAYYAEFLDAKNQRARGPTNFEALGLGQQTVIYIVGVRRVACHLAEVVDGLNVRRVPGAGGVDLLYGSIDVAQEAV